MEECKVIPIEESLKRILEWRVISTLVGDDEDFNIIISYNEVGSKTQNIKILGAYKKEHIIEKIIGFSRKFLKDVNSFGLLITSDSGFCNNWEIETKK